MQMINDKGVRKNLELSKHSNPTPQRNKWDVCFRWLGFASTRNKTMYCYSCSVFTLSHCKNIRDSFPMLDSGCIIYFSLQIGFVNRVNSLLFHESPGKRDMIQCMFLTFHFHFLYASLSAIFHLWPTYLLNFQACSI